MLLEIKKNKKNPFEELIPFEHALLHDICLDDYDGSILIDAFQYELDGETYEWMRISKD